MAQRFGGLLYLSQIGPHLRESKPFSFDASLDASKQSLNTSSLHRSFANSVKGRDRYPYLAYCSLETIALSSPLGWARGWFAGVSDLLESVGIQMDRLPRLDIPWMHLATSYLPDRS
jgi:hypothetical protein